MEFSVPKLNQIISDFENSLTITDAELDWLEDAVLSGKVRKVGRAGLRLFSIRAKTGLFERNFYTMEAVRVLVLNGRKERVRSVAEEILKQLKEKCYGQFCPTGECYETSVCVLRFLRAACPYETAWIAKIEDGVRVHLSDRVRTKAVQRYAESALE